MMVVPNNVLILADGDFCHGISKGIELSNNELALAENHIRGSFQSQEYSVLDYVDVVPSWNSWTPEGTSIELQVRVRQGDKWSRWFSYGQWSDMGRNSGLPLGQQDDMAQMDMGQLRLLKGTGQGVQYQLQLTRANPATPSPRVRRVAFSWPPDLGNADYTNVEIALDVPPRPQLPVPEIGNRICSPTSLSMVMAYHGVVQDVEQVAAGVRDNESGIYGSWIYNVAYASERGFAAWVQRCHSMNDVKAYLLQGLPIVASIKIAAKKDLEGAHNAYPHGHLVVVTGLTHREGQDYVLVNDPACHQEQDVPRHYRLDQFVRAWTRRGIYVLSPEK